MESNTSSLSTALVVVVGSANLDLVVRARRTPQPGETILGDHLSEHAGGKGLNQAISAARRTPTAFVGMIGSDRAGHCLRTALTSATVDVSFVRVSTTASGVAVVNVVTDGENSITVIPGANDEVTAEQTISALDALRPQVVVTQLETPLDSVVAAFRWTRAHGARLVFNPSPLDRLAEVASDHAIRELMTLADPLIVNSDEARSILRWSSVHEERDSSILAVAARLATTYTSVVVTDGANGAYVGDQVGISFIPAPKVRAVDTTGAGDCFAGTLAGRLADNASLEQASRDAVSAAAALVATARNLR